MFNFSRTPTFQKKEWIWKKHPKQNDLHRSLDFLKLVQEITKRVTLVAFFYIH